MIYLFLRFKLVQSIQNKELILKIIKNNKKNSVYLHNGYISKNKLYMAIVDSKLNQ